MFQKGDLVWIKTKLYPLWPGSILKDRQLYANGSFYYDVKFIADSSTAIVYEGDLYEFDTDRQQYRPQKGVLKKFKNLGKALDQATKMFEQKRPGRIAIGEQSKKPKIPGKQSQPPSEKQKPKRKQESIRGLAEAQIRLKGRGSNSNPRKQKSIQNQQEQSQQSVGVDLQSDEDFSDSAKGYEDQRQQALQISERLPKLMRAETSRPKIIEKPQNDSSHSTGKEEQMRLKKRQKQEASILSMMKFCLKQQDEKQDIQQKSQIEDADMDDIRFRLEVIFFQVINEYVDSAEVAESFRILQTTFNTQKINFRYFIEKPTRICELLSYFITKLSDRFSEHHLSWMKSTLQYINVGFLKELNSFQYYSKWNELTRTHLFPDTESEKSKQKPKQSVREDNKECVRIDSILQPLLSERKSYESPNQSADSGGGDQVDIEAQPQQRSQEEEQQILEQEAEASEAEASESSRRSLKKRIIEQKYKNQITEAFKEKLPNSNKSDIIILAEQVLGFLDQRDQDTDKNWSLLNDFISSNEYEHFQDCYRKINDYMESLVSYSD